MVNVDELFSRNAVHSITKDKFGFIWIGTEDGPARYDGKKFTFFAPGKMSFQFLEDSENNFWITTYKGLGKFDFEADTFKFYCFVPEKNYVELNSDFMVRLYEDTRHKFWITTNGGGITCFDPKSLEHKHFSREQKGKYFFPDNMNVTILMHKSGKLLIGTENIGLVVWDTASGACRLITHIDKEKKRPIVKPREMIPDDNGNFWMITEGSGLIQLNADNLEVIRQFKSDTTNINSLTDDFLKGITQDPKDKNILWLSGNGGLNKFNIKTFENQRFTHFVNTHIEQSTSNVYCTYLDELGTLWIGTDIGLFKMEHNFTGYSVLPNSYVIAKDRANAILEDQNKKLWVAYFDQFSLKFYDYKSKKMHSPKDKHGKDIIADFIYDLRSDKNGLIWIGSRNGLFTYDTTSLELKKISIGKAEKYPVWNIKLVDDDVWVSSGGGGLVRIDLPSMQVTNYLHDSTDTQSLASNSIGPVCKYSQNEYWIGGINGIQLLDLKKNKFTRHFTHTKGAANSVADNIICSISKDKDGFLWIGSNGGLQRFDPSKNEFKYINLSTVDNKITALEILSDSELVVCNTLAVYIVNTKTLEVFNRSKVSSERLNLSAGNYYLSPTGMLFLSSTEGIVKLDVRYKTSHKDLASIKLSNLKVYNKTIKKGELGIYNDPIYMEDEFVFDHTENYFQFEFTLLSYFRENQLEYAYMLEGFDKDWNHVGNNNFATYTNLDPGTYNLKIRASDAFGEWHENKKPIKIIILPVFWQTWWFRVISVLFITLLVYAFFYYRTRRIRLRNKLLKDMVEERTHEIVKQKEEISYLYNEVTDSIKTAEMIQKSILPSDKEIKELFPEFFILYRPRDIVSGDFYWIYTFDSKKYIAAFDCTGHGVAGAFMSLIGYNLVSQVMNKHKNLDAGDVLKHLSDSLIEALHQDKDEYISRDGMDASLLIFDNNSNKIQFSGANNPLYRIRNNELEIFKGSKNAVGFQFGGRHPSFETIEIEVQKDDIFYLFSDGLAGQMGGEDGQQKFMYKGLRTALFDHHKFSMTEQRDMLNDKLKSWKGAQDQTDDILVIGVKIV